MLVPRIYKYSKRDFEHVIKLRILKEGNYLDYLDYLDELGM
jgi:hypothetical protein